MLRFEPVKTSVVFIKKLDTNICKFDQNWRDLSSLCSLTVISICLFICAKCKKSE